jgi:hypothetical protein
MMPEPGRVTQRFGRAGWSGPPPSLLVRIRVLVGDKIQSDAVLKECLEAGKGQGKSLGRLGNVLDQLVSVARPAGLLDDHMGGRILACGKGPFDRSASLYPSHSITMRWSGSMAFTSTVVEAPYISQSHRVS